MAKTISRLNSTSFYACAVWFAGCTFVLLTTGCEETRPVVTYTIPLEEPDEFKSEKSRMLAAMVPLTDQVWFFKVTGPESAVELVRDDLRQFVEQVSFEGDEPKLDELPEGWRKGGKQTQFRFASINVDTPEKQLDISVSKLGRQPDWDSMVAMNVNRWRGQLGLDNSDDKWADGEPIDVAAVDDKAVWVDIVGDGSPAGGSMMGGSMSGFPSPPNRTTPNRTTPNQTTPAPSAPASPSALPPMPPPIGSVAAGDADDIPPMEPDPRLKFDRPEGWRDGRMNSMRMAAFNVGPDDRLAEITVIPAGGDLRGNVARWLGQALGSVAPEEVVDAAMEAALDVNVDGRDGKRFILSGNGEDDGTAIDATIVPMDGGMSLFIKMTGPKETLNEQTQKIDEFLKSIKLKM
ncbi:hypothetical protein LF1_31420 [Rubripirellula obstinata]|uniref:Uncharacterized protein n=1 Tax=Rubripirellula obstinata TaxID=406547 RepID=A0A5B1CJY1_9BACT|nr:hypothetical protein [Rubripirellula obstinata]KAA1260602.1 hypothetical protein LF1_31420 [Rubripirellula obstinata]